MKRHLLLLLLVSSSLFAQSFDTSAGGSQVYSAYGVRTDYKWGNITGWSGLGYNDGMRIGAYARVPLVRKPLSVGDTAVGYHVGIGDQMLTGFVGTDEFDTHSFTVRGISFVSGRKNSVMETFSGYLSQETSLPYMHVSTTNGGKLGLTPLGAMVYKLRVSDTLTFHSLNTIGNKLTSIQSLAWRPSKTWRFAGAVGVGSGAGYFAGSSDLHQRTFDLRTSYTISGSQFQRQEGLYYSTEPNGLNARLSISPASSMKITLDHEGTRTAITGLAPVTSTYDTGSFSTTIRGLQLSPTISSATTKNMPGRTNTEMLSASKTIMPRWRAFGAVINMESPAMKQLTFVATNEFKISPRLSIRQNFNRMNGQNTFSAGGEWRSNRVSFTVDQQVYISPLAPAFGGKSVFQAWTFSVRLRSLHGSSTNVNTIIDPYGKMQWGGYIAGLRYTAVQAYRSDSPTFSKYSVRGKVADEAGKGVWGIAIQIGQELVITDEAGEFYLDVKNSKPMLVTVAKESSVQTLYWHLISAPATAQGRLDAAPDTQLQITVSTNPVRA